MLAFLQAMLSFTQIWAFEANSNHDILFESSLLIRRGCPQADDLDFV